MVVAALFELRHMFLEASGLPEQDDCDGDEDKEVIVLAARAVRDYLDVDTCELVNKFVEEGSDMSRLSVLGLVGALRAALRATMDLAAVQLVGDALQVLDDLLSVDVVG